jgi:hypothetical protein
MECASYFDFCRLAETSREKARLYIAALLFNVACWSDARKPDHRPTLTSSVVASLREFSSVWLRLWPHAGEQRGSLGAVDFTWRAAWWPQRGEQRGSLCVDSA